MIADSVPFFDCQSEQKAFKVQTMKLRSIIIDNYRLLQTAATFTFRRRVKSVFKELLLKKTVFEELPCFRSQRTLAYKCQV